MRLRILPLIALVSALSGQTADDFFNDTVLHELRIEINPADWQRLKTNFRDNTYYEINLTWRNVTVEQAGIRSSGFGSRNPIKPNFRLDFDAFEDKLDFLGLKSLKVDANPQDPSQMRERLTMLLFGRLGVPAPRETHARLFVNDVYHGLYNVVETIDKRFLRRNYNEDDGFLYEFNYVMDFRFQYLGADLTRYSPAMFEPKTHERDPDPRPIEAFVRTVNQASDSNFVNAVSEYVDLRKFLTHVAIESYMAEFDGLLGEFGMANFYFYRFEKKNLHTFIVWDKDNCFSSVSRSVFRHADTNVLVRRALAVPELRTHYLNEVARAANLAGGTGGWLDQQIDRVYAQIRAAALADPNKQCPQQDFVPGTGLRPCTNEDFEAGVRYLHTFVGGRPDVAFNELFSNGYQPAAGPRLSTGGAVNAAGSTPGLTAGSLASVYGEGFGTTIAQVSSLPVATTLAGVSILVNGVPAPVLFVSPNQVNIQVPWETPTATVNVTGSVDGAPGNTITAPVRAAAPGVFVVVHADGALVNAARPAEAGSILVVYATGLGAVTQNIATGAATPGSPLSPTREAATVRIGGQAVEVLFAGLTPGFVGLYQINLRVLPGVPAGAQTPMIITVSGQSSAATPLVTR